ncbi:MULTISPECIES: element excision factor XisH family protein [Planktothricoides]|uniref:Element excision factor XisH family protein n=2 Tax=Planktothricoides raciborskii TaxID=132608 RepID=A0AAU8JG28_9CYAN|nr:MULTISPECIES: element excision factor XisH family protein [Planktothricoides]KOR37696.1 fatty-acid synthase [Planktothricoides sp. SR001]MBD2544130.1 XisH family protein [Planktothricoides raciborskii FACHB-1370]MBD2582615.1 XisH family protein [Planktothricoides raciborskii FACHB-1261]
MAKDIYHEAVKIALIKDGWTITEDPLRLKFGGRMTYVDLGAEKLLAAQKEGQQIAVEVKSFLNPSPVKDLEQALGQYIMYSQVLAKLQQNRLLYLAIPQVVFYDFFSEELPKLIVEINQIKLLVFNPESQEVCQWIA